MNQTDLQRTSWSWRSRDQNVVKLTVLVTLLITLISYQIGLAGTSPATLTIVKQIDPAGNQSFDFDVNGTECEPLPLNNERSDRGTLEVQGGCPTITYDIITPTLTDGGSGLVTGTFQIPAPRFNFEYTVSVEELVPDGWQQTAGSCESNAIPSAAQTVLAGIGLGPVTAIVQSGGFVTCTFSNAQFATLTIIKDAQPNTPKPFFFTLSDGEVPRNFNLIDDGTVISNTTVFTDLVPGTSYTLDEFTPSGWGWVAADCNAQQQLLATTPNGIDNVSVTPLPGEQITCTMINRRTQITVIKEADPESDQPFDFIFATEETSLQPPLAIVEPAGQIVPPPQPFTLIDNGTGISNTRVFSELLANGQFFTYTYRITETVPANWRLTSTNCVNQNNNPTAFGATATFSLLPGDQYTCTFTNEEYAQIIVVKEADPSDGTDFEIVLDLGDAITQSVKLDDAQPNDNDNFSDTFTFSGLLPAVYNLTETPVNGWLPPQIDCSNQGGAIGTALPPNGKSLTLNNGDDVTCTVRNVKIKPSIALTKTVGTIPGVCSNTRTITVLQGTTVYYCITVQNTGNITLPLHDLYDSELDQIFQGLAIALPSNVVTNTVAAGRTISATIETTTTNTAIWTAYVDNNITATASAQATVNVVQARPSIAITKTVGTVSGQCAAPGNLVAPFGTRLFYCITVQNTGSTTFTSHLLIDPLLNLSATIPFLLPPGGKLAIDNTRYPTLGTITLTKDITNTVFFTAGVGTGQVPTVDASALAAEVTATASASVRAIVQTSPTALGDTDEPIENRRQLFLPMVRR